MEFTSSHGTEENRSWRFCVEYRKLNNVTHHDAYTLPRIDATLGSLAGSTLFTTLDLASGYWQVEVDAEHKEKIHQRGMLCLTSCILV